MKENKNLPVKVGQTVKVNIEAMGEKGDGVAKVSGYAVFVPNTNMGDKVKVKITKTFNKFGFAEVI